MQLTEQLAQDYQYFFNFALKNVGDYHLAQDVVQEAFLKAQTTLATPRGNYKTWLCRIIRTTFFDECKRRKLLQTVPMTIDISARNDPIQAAQEIELGEKVSFIIISNKSQNVATVLDYAFSDCSRAQFSAEYKISFKAVNSRLHRGREQLRKELADFI